jgi:hypothetical protein
MSALGQKQTLPSVGAMSALHPKADITRSPRSGDGGRAGAAHSERFWASIMADKSSHRLNRKISEYRKRPYKNSLAEQLFLRDANSARETALTISPDSEYNAAILKAFAAFGLDPGQPDHHRKLLAILADVFFGERRPGPKVRWDFEEFAQLLSDVDEVRTKYRLKGKKLFEKLKKDVPYCKRYAGVTVSTLRARHRDAQNPRHNRLLKTVRKDRLEAVLRLISKKWKSQ